MDNALKVVYLLGNHDEVRLSEVAELLGVASSTAHRLLAALQYRGFSIQNPLNKTYKPGPALSQISYSILQRFDVRTEVRPLLIQIQREFRETVHLAVREGTNVRYIDGLESPQTVRVVSRVGQLLPANCSSSGKALLAELDISELHGLFRSASLETVNERSISTLKELETELEVIRKCGYGLSLEESEDGVTSVATVLPQASNPMHLAVSLSFPSGRISKQDIEKMGRKLHAMVASALVK
ncbi:IclR family transcriptional regulator (plasmid) [Glutamicibacter sp. PAEs-4]|uniref:IclR family transcriptional regulator n=1 Tax=Glutamicibacter TaxID=1742989 RepID=UPI001CBDA799